LPQGSAGGFEFGLNEGLLLSFAYGIELGLGEGLLLAIFIGSKWA
jgi:hypothetical protein